MVVLHGDAGVGKSKGAQKYLRDHSTSAVKAAISSAIDRNRSNLHLFCRSIAVIKAKNRFKMKFKMKYIST